MASAIDPTVIVDGEKVDKADLREQFEIAANEITALQTSMTTAQTDITNLSTDVDAVQAAVSLARQMMVNNTLFTTL